MTLIIKNIQFVLLTLLLTLFFCETKAQTNMAFYPLEDQFNASTYNPAFLFSESQYTFSAFPFSGFNFGFNNQEVIRKLTDKLRQGINTDEEYLDLVRSMVDRRSFNLRLETDILSFTARTSEGFLNFRIRENVFFSASIRGPVSGFMIKPEIQSIEVGQVQNVPLMIIHYREYSLGYSSPSEHQDFSWGARAKLYYGKGVFSSGISGSVENVADYHYFKTNGYGKMSMPGEESGTLNISSSIISDYLLNSGNTGVGFDLGFRLRLGSKLSLTFSALDLGKIYWKNNLTSKDFKSQSLLDETKLSTKIENGIEIVSKTKDSISFENKFTHLFRVDNRQQPFKTSLPVTLYSGVKYQLNRKLSLNFVDRYISLRNMNHNSMMLSTALNMNRKFAMNVGFEVIDQDKFNVPLAFLFKRNFGQAYIGTDNLIAFLSPYSARYSGITFGLCFYVFRKRDLYNDPDEAYPFFRPKKVKKVINNGRIQKESTEFGFPEMY